MNYRGIGKAVRNCPKVYSFFTCLDISFLVFSICRVVQAYYIVARTLYPYALIYSVTTRSGVTTKIYSAR